MGEVGVALPARGQAAQSRRLRPGVTMPRTHATPLAGVEGMTLLADRAGLPGHGWRQPRSVRADGGVARTAWRRCSRAETPPPRSTSSSLATASRAISRTTTTRRVDQAVNAFLGAHPIKALRSAFNIHRVNVTSPESGTDKFAQLRHEHRHRRLRRQPGAPRWTRVTATAARGRSTAAWAPPIRRSLRGSPPTLLTTTSSSCS